MRHFTIVAATLLLATLPAALLAQSAPPAALEEIRREMQQLQQDYQRRMQALEAQLLRLEQAGPAPQTATNLAAIPTPPPQPVAAGTNQPGDLATGMARVQSAQSFINREFAETTTTRDFALSEHTNAPLKQRVENILNRFIDIGGYFRAGYGGNNIGGPQVAFQAPGTLAKYRLGNEAENYGELIFGKNWWVPGTFSTAAPPPERADGTPDGPIARVQLRMSFYAPYSDYNNSAATQVGLPEAWAAIGNILPGQSEMKFWAGNRFYRRYDIHANDFFFWNNSGGGAGVEDIKLPTGKLAFAWIGASGQSGLYNGIPQPDPENKAGFSKGNWDLRLYELPMPLGQAELGVIYSTCRTGLDADGRQAEQENGPSFNFVHTAENFLGPDSLNRFSLQSGWGTAMTFNSGFETFSYSGKTFIRPSLPGSWRFRVTENLVMQPFERLAIEPVMLYQYSDYGAGYSQNWFSAGARPIFFLTKNFNVAFEGGVDYVNNHPGRAGNLYKLTIAPEVQLGPTFFSRPVIRFFATYAHWSQEFVGRVGGQDYLNSNEGWTFGAQMESWW